MLLPPRIQPEQHHDNYQQDNLPKNKNGRIESSEIVARIQINDQRSEADAADEPDYLSFRVPHQISYFGLWAFEKTANKVTASG